MIFTDSALTNVVDDKLGRSLLAKEIALGIVHSFDRNLESVVIGVNGAWGTGKSTLVNFIINEIEVESSKLNRKVIFLRFNPWMFSGQEQLQRIFLTELFLKLRSRRGKFKKVAKQLARYLGHFESIKYLEPVKLVTPGIGGVITSIKDLFHSLTKDRELTELKADLDKILLKEGLKVYITIDDIDRLLPSEITQVFQLVKLNGSFANTIFILAYDRKVVCSALESTFQKQGAKYLEKIVQVDYTLPAVSSTDLVRIFIDAVTISFNKPINESISESFSKMESEKFIQLFTSIRDVYRFVNGLKVRLPSIYTELNIRDFFAIESLRIFRPDAYEFILANKNELTHQDRPQPTRYSVIDGTSVSNVDRITFVIDEQKFDKIASLILKDLFAIRGDVVARLQELIRDQRAANRSYFDRYFNLQLSDLDIQESLFQNFIGESPISIKLDILQSVAEKNRLRVFFDWLKIRLTYSQNIDELILPAVLLYLDTVPYKREYIYIESDFLATFRFAAIFAGNVVDFKKSKDKYLDYLNSSLKVPTFSSVYLCDSMVMAKDRFKAGELKRKHLWSSLFFEDDPEDEVTDKVLFTSFIDDVSRFYEDGIRRLFLNVANSPLSFTLDEMQFILFRIKDIDRNMYDQEFGKILDEPKALLKLLLFCVSQRFMPGGGTVAFSLSSEELFPNMDFEDIKSRLNKIDISTLDTEELKTVRFFNRFYSDGLISDAYYYFDTAEPVVE